MDVRDSATKKYGAVTVTYKQNGVVLNGAPIEPGTYTFTANVAATATCAGGDVTPKYNTFTIQKAALNPKDFTVTEPTDLTYNGSAKEVTVKNTSDKDYGEITVTYKQNGEALNGAPTEPGEYSYTVTAAGSARYVGGIVKTGSFRITKTGTTDPEPEKTYQLTVAGADITLPEDADASALKAGQLVSLTAYPDTDTVHFAQWVVSGADGALSPADLMDAADEPLTEDAFKQRTLTFRMPAKSLTITRRDHHGGAARAAAGGGQHRVQPAANGGHSGRYNGNVCWLRSDRLRGRYRQHPCRPAAQGHGHPEHPGTAGSAAVEHRRQT